MALKLLKHKLRQASIPERLVYTSALVLLVWGTVFVYYAMEATIKSGRIGFIDQLDWSTESLALTLRDPATQKDHDRITRMLLIRARRIDIAELAWLNNTLTPIIVTGPEEQPDVPTWFKKWTDLQVYERTLPITPEQSDAGKIRVRMIPVQETHRLWHEFIRQCELLILGIAAVLGGILVVISQSLRPLSGFAAGSQRFGSGDYGFRLPKTGSPELAIAAEAFNTMANNIESMVCSLRDYNAINQKLASIVEQSREAIITTDLDQHILSWNPAAETMFLYTKDQVLNQHISVIHPPVASKQPWSPSKPTFEFTHIGANGKMSFIATSMSTLFDSEQQHVGYIYLLREVTQQRLAEEALFHEQERARVTLNSISEGIITTDRLGRVEYMNTAASTMTHWPLLEANARHLDEIFQPVDTYTGKTISQCFSRLMAGTLLAATYTECGLVIRTGSLLSVQASVAPLRDKYHRIIGLAITFRDIGESRRLERMLFWQEYHDPLTGLTNRPHFERRLAQLVDDARQQQHTLIYIDIDQFRIVNDTCGNQAGDNILREIAQLLQKHISSNDSLARLGGNAFGILMAQSDLEHSRILGETIRHTIASNRFHYQDLSFSLSVSIGIISITSINTSNAAMTLLAQAETACLQAKEQGRNRVHIYHPNTHDNQQRQTEMQWISKITQACEAGQFKLYCQKIIATNAYKIQHTAEIEEHYELLVRMVDQDGSLVAPGSFIPAAERYNLMSMVDQKVIELAINTYKHHQAHDAQHKILMSINLSGASIGDPSFTAWLQDHLNQKHITPSQFCFEITETSAINNLAKASKFVTTLKSLGCRFSLDDFGSGFSSFAYLKTLPVDFLKIDGDFVRDMPTNRTNQAIVEAMNRLGRVMGIRTIAEFVENETTLAMLEHIGVDFVQGYAIGIPIPIEDALSLAQA